MKPPLDLLVIEADADDFRLLQNSLQQQGLAANCTQVETDAQLVAALQTEWDLVLSDYNPLGMETLATLQRIRAKWPLLPVILVAGTVGEENAVALLRAGISDIILKQNLMRLEPVIRRVLNEASEHRALGASEQALHASQAAASAAQREARLAALNLMEDAVAARNQSEAMNQALRASEERLTLALRAANQGIYDLNVQTGEAIVSPEYASMLGYDPATFHESNSAWLARLHPDDLERVSQCYQDYVASRLPEYRVEFRQKTSPGEWKWILSVGQLVERDSTGAPLRMTGTHTDITERKRNESTLFLQARRGVACVA